MSEEDFANEIRGDGDDVPGNSKQNNSWFPALAVGVVISLSQLYVAKQSDRGDTLIEVKTQLSILVKQFDDFTKRGYISKEDFDKAMERLDRRIDALERK